MKIQGLRRSSIAARLTRMNLMVSGMALLLAYFSFFSYDLLSSRQNLVQNLQTDAQITGSDTVSALLFDDAISARSTLAALRHSADIDYAALITDDGRIFAEYRNPDFSRPSLPPLAGSQMEQTWERGRHVTIAERIIFQGKPEGVIYIVANLRELAARAGHYLLIAAVILGICLIVALVGSLKFRKVLAGPVEELAETAWAVAHKRDYSVRARPSSEHDELDVLTEAFNEMLSQIQQQETRLRAAHDDLERRVQERTKELTAVNSELESFSYAVAHDLRGPLEVIDSSMFLLQQAEREEQESELINRSRQTTQNMALLIDDLLQLSRVTIANIKRESVNLTALAQEIEQDLRLLEPWRKVQMKIVPDCIVQGDAGLLRGLMENLLRNAWKYTSKHEEACIEVGCFTRNGEIICFVRDDGAGFDPKLSEKLFQPFQRLHSKEEFTGTGIGLATVHRIITRHGGRIWAEGDVERGATFYFTL